jgi:hypothetical protein
VSAIIADLILVAFIFLMFRSVQFDNEAILAEAERASVLELLLSSVFVIGGFYLVHVLMYGVNANASLGSRGIMVIVCYELIGMFIYLLFKEKFIRFLRWTNELAPFLLKVPVGFELIFCCYLLVTNILQ